MPVTVTETAGGQDYGNPFVGPVNHTQAVRLDISGMTDDEVDAEGYLKPGVPLKSDGTLCGDGEAVHGIVVEAQKVDDDNSDLANGDDQDVVVATICQVNRDVVEDNLGRALTAFEIAGMPGGIVLTTT